MKKIKIISFFLISFLYSGLIFAQSPTIDDAKKLTVREQYVQAEDMFKNLIKDNPQMGDLYYYYGENEMKAFFSDTITLTQRETSLKCRRLFEKGLEMDPSNPINYIGLARIDYFSGKKTESSENVNKVNTMIPPMTVKIKKIPDPVRYAQLLAEMAKIYILQDNTDTAAAMPLLRRAIQADPKNASLFITIGDAFLYLKDVNNAIQNYNIAQSLNPNSSLAKLRIGYLYIRAKNLNTAIQSLEEALKIDPNFAPAYKELGFVYSLAGKPEKSKPNYLKYLELSGNNIPAKISYVIALFKSADYKECISQINQIFAVDSSINSMNRVIAYSYCEVKEYVKAQYYLEKFLKIIGNDPDKIITKDYTYYGKILGERGKADLAEEKLRTALGIDPTMNYLYTDIATYQSKAKNYKKAIAALNEKIAAKSAKIGDYCYLGKAYYQDSSYTEADQTFETLLNMKDPNLKSYEMLAISYQCYARTYIDTTMTGFALVAFEKLIEKALVDSTKNSKYLIDGYSYLGSYYLFSKTGKDYPKSKFYFRKVLAIDPNNKQAQAALKTQELQKAKLPD